MATYSRVLRQVELWENEQALQEARQRDAAAGDAGPDSKKPRLTLPPDFHIGFTSGSVHGVVGRMAESQNPSRAAAFLSEGGIFKQWLTDQASGQQGLITQLTDRIVWDKATDRTTVLVVSPKSLNTVEP
ncbi:unnamed protein product [Symbiodinium sp. CCMP2592]|nr:unnamed protein product [Symbiodinium sp. CCMP2592]